jgi:hypothetical protein
MATLQKHNTKNSKQIFPENELLGLSPNFQINVYVSNFIFPWFGLPILLHENMWTDPGNIYINRSQTHECGTWDWGSTIPFLGIYNWDFRCSAQC